ncbi:MAG: hypothetical protein P8L71_13735 [Flavobacteriales bacterium]|nr:hypothetical protein [Flavobacteriales bacterium]
MGKKIILACFDFPPNAGIGGRRWAKLAKGLALSGVEVHVIKAAPVKGYEHSGWQDDINSDLIHIHTLERTYPEVVSHGPTNLWGKLKYRSAIAKLQKIEKGTIYDVAIGWKDAFLSAAEQLIQDEGIENLVATGAPFNILYYAAIVKERNPNINLLVDYRDPWLTAENYGMKDLSPERMKAEITKQELVFKHADMVMCPNEFLLEEIQQTGVQQANSSFKSLPHFFDPDDLDAYLQPTNASANQINLVYGGAIYIGLEETLKSLADALKKLKASSPTSIAKLRVTFYTPHQQFASIFDGLEDYVSFKPTIGKDFFTELNKATAAIILLAEHNKNYLTTKFFEYLPFKKPLVFMGAKGHTSSFISTHKLGHVLKDDFSNLGEVLELLEAPLTDNSFSLEKYTLSNRVEELRALLK